MGQPENDEPQHEPNEYGFAGGATAPEPELSDREVSEGEEIAIPSGDITGALVAAIDDAMDRGHHKEQQPQEPPD